jgi:DNA-binding transcriptional LysR family regulator
MPALLARFALRHPSAAVELSVANTSVLLERLRRLELDVAFVEGDVLAPGLLLSEWTHDALCLVARAGHPIAERFAGRGPVLASREYVGALAAASWAIREPGSGTADTFLRAIAPAIGAPRVGLVADDPLALQRLVAGGDWLACMSRRAVVDAFANGTLVELPAPGAAVARALTRRFWIVRLPERYRSDAVDALLALAAEPEPVPVRRPAAAAPRSGPRPRSRR